ncbi:GNAT family N-acetyltransferase [Aureisphaera galaxeae]|uniref:GNAT family N-acetyltransferase n=1 Tax=Aureisphaera galaxeae TaxID=1538023 RepID=UPI0023509889|nr:GNAT family N-acetyltransferase [Aureisphaera galaxeae]MDC8005190.1 GNAT family N-acetyltransferase [Aureisphaera galaxeae]
MIQKGKLSQIEEIMVMTRACGAKMIANGIYQWNEHYPNPKAFIKDIEREELYVLTNEENTIMGTIVISTLKDEEYESIDWLTPDGNNYYIHRLAIHPDFQHQGLAKKMMDFAESEIRKNHGVSVRLDTFSKNPRNQRFYEKRGYERLGDIYFPKQSEDPFYCYELIL